jgi:hypothetical protein
VLRGGVTAAKPVPRPLHEPDAGRTHGADGLTSLPIWTSSLGLVHSPKEPASSSRRPDPSRGASLCEREPKRCGKPAVRGTQSLNGRSATNTNNPAVIVEDAAVRKVPLQGMSAVAAATFIAALTSGVSAQDKKMAPAEKFAACNTLTNEAACKAGKDCSWVAESKNDKVKRKAYCRSNPMPKKDDAKKK